MRWWKWIVLAALALAAAGYFVIQSRLSAPLLDEDAVA